jgi:hypothetical protein
MSQNLYSPLKNEDWVSDSCHGKLACPCFPGRLKVALLGEPAVAPFFNKQLTL